MTIDELTYYRNLMAGLLLICMCGGAICTYYATTFNNKLNSLQRDKQTNFLLNSNKNNTQTILDTLSISSIKHSNETNNVLRINEVQSKFAKQNFTILQKQDVIREKQNKQLFENQIQQLTDLFPNQDFNNFNGQFSRYSEIKEKIHETLLNPYTFDNSGFKYLSKKIISHCDIMKAFFHNRSIGVQTSICNNKEMSGNDLDNCMYDSFRTEYVEYLNLSFKVKNK